MKEDVDRQGHNGHNSSAPIHKQQTCPPEAEDNPNQALNMWNRSLATQDEAQNTKQGFIMGNTASGGNGSNIEL